MVPLFSNSEFVSRNEWKEYIEHSMINRNLPGIQGVGFSLIIPKEKLNQHIIKIQKEGFPEYRIYPNGERDIYTSIIYLEPFSGRNLRAFGYDMFSESVRRKAMERARDYDIASISGKVLLIQETNQDIQAGTLIYVPVYKKNSPTNTVEERRSAMIGWVYSPYRMNDLMEGILGDRDSISNGGIRLKLFDNNSTSPDSLMFDSQNNNTTKSDFTDERVLNLPIEFNGKEWTLHFSQPKNNIKILNSKVWLALINGTIISLLLYVLTLALLNTKLRAKQIAEELTNELKKSETNLKNAQSIAHIGSWTWNIKTNQIDLSEEIYNIFGIKNESFSGIMIELVNNFIQSDDKKKNGIFTSLDNRILLPDGSIRFVHLEQGKLEFDKYGKPEFLTGIIQDITELKLIDEKLHISQKFLDSIIENSPTSLWVSDENGTLIRMNQACRDILKINNDEVVGKYNIFKDKLIEEQGLLQLVNDVFENGNTVRFEISYDTSALNELELSKTTKLILDVNISPILDANGKVINAVIQHLDITESKNHEKTLRKAEEVGKFGNWNLQLNDNLITSSDGARTIYGLEENENPLELIQKMVLPEYRPKLNQTLFDLINSDDNYDVEFKILRESDNQIIDIHSIAEYDADKNIVFGTIQDISERKKVEEALKQNEEYFRTLFENNSSALIVIENDTSISLVNQEASIISGYSKEELLSMKWVQMIHPEDLKIMMEYNKRRIVNPNDPPNKYDIRIFKKNKEPRSLHLSIAQLDDKKNIVSLVDITERKLVEEMHRNAEIYNRSLLEASLDPLVTIDHNGFISDVNVATENVTGYSRLDIIGTDFSSYFSIPQLAKEGYEQVFKVGYVIDYPLEIKHKNGMIISVLYNASVYKDINGSIVGVFAAARDITERKKIEQALKKSELKFRTVADYTYDWEYWEGIDGELLYMSPSSERMSGYKPEEFISDKNLLKNIIYYEDFNLVDSHLENIHSFDQQHKIEEIDFRIVKKDGTIAYIGHLCRPVFDDNNNYLGRRISNRDITNRKLAEEEEHKLIIQIQESKEIIESNLFQKNILIDELSETKEKLEKINSEKDKFFSIIAHDLKSPFNGFLGLTRIMVEEIQELSMEEVHQFSKSMLSSATNLYKLLENLLEWSRIHRGLTKFHPENCFLQNIVNQILEVQSEVAKNKEIEFVNNIHDDIIVTADVQMLNTILRNLISNAIKFTSRGGSVEIGSSIRASEGSIIIYVKDSGIGMTSETISKLFKLDENVSQIGTEGESSTGLGLILSKEFIEKHKGKIWVESEVGKGSTFSFTLTKKTNGASL
jgi:PAS domain S-box-containing protein